MSIKKLMVSIRVFKLLSIVVKAYNYIVLAKTEKTVLDAVEKLEEEG